MLTCPICGAAIDENTRVCPACRANLAGGTYSRGEHGSSNVGGIVVGIVVAVLLFGACVALLMPVRPTAREPARRSNSKSNLKNLALAIHNYHDTYGSFPVADVDRDRGAAPHGWQTLALRFIEEKPLFDSIDFDETWDAPANSSASAKRIAVYQNPGVTDTVDARGYPLIHYAGNVHVLGRTPALTFADITDGSTNTILIGEVTEGLRAWADPRNLRDPGLGLNAGPATFGSPWKDGGVQFVAVDGAVHFVDTATPIPVLKALGTPDGGESVSFPVP